MPLDARVIQGHLEARDVVSRMAKASNKDGLYLPSMVGAWHGTQTIDSLKIAGTVLDLHCGYQDYKDKKNLNLIIPFVIRIGAVRSHCLN